MKKLMMSMAALAMLATVDARREDLEGLYGRAFDIACAQIDIGNAASEMTARMVNGVLQADGSTRPEPRMDLSAVVDAFLTMARLPLSSNMLFVNVMATKMPFAGRG